MDIKDRQCLLTVLKRSNGESYYTGEVDGIYGPLSRKAIEGFQRDCSGLTVTGEADEATDKAMRHTICYGMPVIDVPDINAGNKSDEDINVPAKTGTFLDEIEFFAREEFKCKCGGKYCNGYPAEPDERMVRIADAIRKRIGKPITVNSGLRCKTHNANVGGVSNSQHLYGTAADLGCPSGCTPSQMASIAEEIMGETGGIGIYSWGIHIDTRSTKSRWNG